MRLMQELYYKYAQREDRLITFLKSRIKEQFDEKDPMIAAILKSTSRDDFFSRFLHFNQEGKKYSVSVSGTQRRRINVKCEGINKNITVPQHIWDEINQYDLTLKDNRAQLEGYGWEVVANHILNTDHELLGKLKDDIGNAIINQNGGKTKTRFDVDFTYSFAEKIDNSNANRLTMNVDAKSNIYNFGLGTLSNEEAKTLFGKKLTDEDNNEYHVMDYIKLHILNKKFNKPEAYIFYAPQNARAMTLSSVLNNSVNLYLKSGGGKFPSNQEIFLEAARLYQDNIDYYQEQGYTPNDIINFLMEGRKNTMSTQLRKELMEDTRTAVEKKVRDVSLWYGSH